MITKKKIEKVAKGKAIKDLIISFIIALFLLIIIRIILTLMGINTEGFLPLLVLSLLSLYLARYIVSKLKKKLT